jgi:hypothetical protein
MVQEVMAQRVIQLVMELQATELAISTLPQPMEIPAIHKQAMGKAV